MIFVSTLRSGEGLADFACAREKNILAKETPTFDVGLCINRHLNEFVVHCRSQNLTHVTKN